MEYKLAYKTYSFGISLASCKRFSDSTKLDLHTVLMDYIYEYTRLSNVSTVEKITCMSKLYSRDIACKLFSAITDKEMCIPLEEFHDATFRTSWFQVESLDDMSEPWPLVVMEIAMKVNEYITDNIHVKKKDIKEG